jgi:hypothetical protein
VGKTIATALSSNHRYDGWQFNRSGEVSHASFGEGVNINAGRAVAKALSLNLSLERAGKHTVYRGKVIGRCARATAKRWYLGLYDDVSIIGFLVVLKSVMDRTTAYSDVYCW